MKAQEIFEKLQIQDDVINEQTKMIKIHSNIDRSH